MHREDPPYGEPDRTADVKHVNDVREDGGYSIFFLDGTMEVK